MGGALRLGTSEVRYARAGDAHVAYRVVQGSGIGTRDVIFVLAGTASMDALFEDPVAVRFLEGLTDLGRLVLFDRCGVGLSDPPSDGDASGWMRWCADLEAVVAATEVERPVLVSAGLGVGVTILYCDHHPTAVSAMVLMEPTHGARVDRDVWRRQIEGEVDSVALWYPSRADEPGFRDWFNRAGQRGASPRRAARAYPGTDPDDIRMIDEAASRVRVPTLVLRRPAHPLSPPRANDPIVALVPGAVRVDLPGEDLYTFGGEVDALIAELTRFVTGEHRGPAPERALAVILFSDVVASTDRATVLGDERWKRLLDRHDEIARSTIARRGGVVIKNLGDGLLATLTSVHNALRAAQELRGALLEEALEVRIGVHVGDIDKRGDDISGVAIAIAARIQNLAAPREILVSSTAMQAATGGSLNFEPRGEHHLKGVPGLWQVFAVTTGPAHNSP